MTSTSRASPPRIATRAPLQAGMVSPSPGPAGLAVFHPAPGARERGTRGTGVVRLTALEVGLALLFEGGQAFQAIVGGAEQAAQVGFEPNAVVERLVQAAVDRLAQVADGQRRLRGEALGQRARGVG